MTERWLPVVGWEGLYEVSDQGRVRSLGREIARRGFPYRVKPKVMKPTVGCTSRSPKGYLGVTLTPLEGGGRRYLVHQLVLTAFRGRRPKGREGAHSNGDHFCNRLSNLAWKTPKENSRDAVRHGVRRRESGRFVRVYA